MCRHRLGVGGDDALPQPFPSAAASEAQRCWDDPRPRGNRVDVGRRPGLGLGDTPRAIEELEALLTEGVHWARGVRSAGLAVTRPAR